MKKILAALLVATMIMSCMTFVSFAATAEVYTIAEYPYAAMSTFDESVWDAMDPVATKYLANFRTITGKTPPQANQTPIYSVLNATNTYFNNGTGAMGTMPAAATPNDIVVIPVYASAPGAPAVAVKATYDAKYLTPVENATISGSAVCEVKDGAFTVSSLNANPVSGMHFALYFTINAAAVGDASGNATTTVKLNVVENANYTIGNQETAVKLTGLVAGVEESNDMTAADYAAIEGINTGIITADKAALNEFLKGFDNATAVDTDANIDSYVALFANVGEYDNVAEVGFSYKTTTGKTGYAAIDPVDGKIGGIFYGLSTALEGLEVTLVVKLTNETVLDTEVITIK